MIEEETIENNWFRFHKPKIKPNWEKETIKEEDTENLSDCEHEIGIDKIITLGGDYREWEEEDISKGRRIGKELNKIMELMII